jgi:predicted dehydrogenase
LGYDAQIVHNSMILAIAGCVLVSAPAVAQQSTNPLRVAIAGLVHGHVDGFLRTVSHRHDVQIVGIFDPDEALGRKYGERYGFSGSILYTDLSAMLDRTRPEAVASFTSTYDHPEIVSACASRGIHVMMEKPLAVSTKHARAIAVAAERGHIKVIVNYETTWYPSHAALWALMRQQAAAGPIRKMVAMDGHAGPKVIGAPPEFMSWLLDPLRNGGGALFDFGCYGANLMTWLMDNQRPVSVLALTQTIDPESYPRVDDEATVLLHYPKAQGIIQASWNWPFGRKDFEVYGERGYAIAMGGKSLRVRLPGQSEQTLSPEPREPEERDSVSYLKAVVRGTRQPSGLSSLENNLIVTEILEAARESARTGRQVRLSDEVNAH